MKKFSFLLSLLIIISVIISGITVSAQSSTFSDINNHWAKDQILKWSDKGIVRGYDDKSFRPDKPITRAEFIALVNRALGFRDKANVNFKDVLADKWYYDEIRKAVNEGYIKGYEDNTIRPENIITRQEAVAILVRIMKATSQADVVSKFKDFSQFPEWSKPYISAAVENGYMIGFPDGTFRPDAPITRAESIAMLDRAIGELYNISGIYDLKGNTIKGSMTIAVADVIIKNAVIEGNLYITSGVGNGNAEINNVTVKGRLIVSGGGVNSVIVRNSSLNEVVINKKDNNVRIVTENSSAKNIKVESGAILEGNSANIQSVNIVSSGKEVKISGNFDKVSLLGESVKIIVTSGTIKELNIEKESAVEISKDAMIQKSDIRANTEIKGEGKIEQAIVETGKVLMDIPEVNKLLVTENAKDATVEITKKAVIESAEIKASSVIKGDGKIKEAVIESSNVVLEKAPDKITSSENVKVVIGDREVTVTPSTGSGGSSSGGSQPYTPPKSSDATLKEIKITFTKDGTSFEQTIGDPVPEEFTYHLPYDEMNGDWMSLSAYQIEVNPVVNNAKATYKVIRPENEEKIIIEVTAENGNKKDYTINFKKVSYYQISQYLNNSRYPKPGDKNTYTFEFNPIKTGEEPKNVVLGIRYSEGPENGSVTINYDGQTIELSKNEPKFITLSEFPEELQLPIKYDADGIYRLDIFLEDMDAVPLSNQISQSEIVVEKVYNFVEPTITIDNSFTFKRMEELPNSFPGLDVIKDIKPVAVTLSTGGTGVSYNNVRLEVNVFKGEEEYKDIQLWAFDGNDWHDIVKEGWGPSEGFTLPVNYNVTTYVYPIVKDYGDYNISVVLFDVEKPFEWFENYKYPVAGAGGDYRFTEHAKFKLETEEGFFNFALKQPLFEENQYGGAVNNNEIDGFIGKNNLQPIEVSIVPDSMDGIYIIGEKGYDAARIVVDSVYMKDNEGNYTIPAEDKIQLWAKDSSGNWYNIVRSGWGPPVGFTLPPYYEATTPVYVIVYEPGEYKVTAKLYDVNTGELLSILEKEYDLTHIYSTYEISFEGTGNVLFSPLLSSENIEQNIESTPDLVPIQFRIKPITVGDLSYDKGVVEVNVYDENGSLANNKVQLWIKDAEGKWINLVDGIETIDALTPGYNDVLDVYAVANEVGNYRVEAALYGMEGKNKRLLSTTETYISLHNIQSLYDIKIPDQFTYFNGTLIEETNGVPNSNQAVDNYIYQNNLSPVPITLKAVAIGDRGYDAVRLTVSAYVYDETNGWVDASNVLQIWAKDTSNNWYNIIKTGWGPLQGFAISPDYNETTEVYVISNKTGEFKIVIELVDVKNNEIIRKIEEYYTFQ